MISLQIQDALKDRWSTAISHRSGHTSYFSIENVANHQDQKTSAGDVSLGMNENANNDDDCGGDSTVDTHLGSEGKDHNLPETDISSAKQEAKPQYSLSDPTTRKRQKSTYPTPKTKTEPSVSASLDMQIDPTTPPPSICNSPGRHVLPAKCERRSHRSRSRKPYCAEGDRASYHRSVTDPFPFHRPAELASITTCDTSTGWYPHSDFAPLMSDSALLLPRNTPSACGAAGMFPFLDMCCDKDEAPNHPPQPVIDWTSPATRRREYEEIDRSCRGLRGLWRKMSPRWCQRNRRLSFHNEHGGSDCGSVRRYRVQITTEEEEEIASVKDGVLISEKEVKPSRPKLIRSVTSWSCFGEKLRQRANLHDGTPISSHIR